MCETKVFIKNKIKEIQEMVKDEKILVTVSGVGSAVSVKLVFMALKDNQIKVITLDDGLRREKDPEWVQKTFEKIGIPVEIIKEEVFSVLGSVTSPAIKRDAYSEWFCSIFAKKAKDFGAKFMVLGTNRLDIDRCAQQKPQNFWRVLRADSEKEFGFRLVEPVKDLYRNEIQSLAFDLNLPPEICLRMPFPAPGLAVRIQGKVTPIKIALVRRATEIIEELLAPLRPYQCLVYLMQDYGTDIKESNGVFKYAISVRSVESRDGGRTALPTRIKSDLQIEITNKILAEISEVKRVVFDQTPKPPQEIEYE